LKKRDLAGKKRRAVLADGVTPERRLQGQNVPEFSRRSLFNWIWAGLGILALAELAWVVAAFLRPRSSNRSSGESEGTAVVEAGPVEKFSPMSVTAFPRGRFYLVRLEDGGFLALSRTCTHLGCTVPWSTERKEFACPCHGSAFDVRGDVIRPPASRPLELYRVFIENMTVKVDTGKRIRRDAFRPEQVVYAKKA
jgi:cytochrome b6-f complex iron-sulfur subunit